MNIKERNNNSEVKMFCMQKKNKDKSCSLFYVTRKDLFYVSQNGI